MKKALFAALVVVLITLGLGLASMVPASAESVPLVWTDKADYAPEDTVVISGSGFDANIDLVVRVTRPDGSIVTGDGTFTPGSDTVTTDDGGSFTYQYQLDGILGTYIVDVMMPENYPDGPRLASTTFTDSRPLRFVETGLPSGTSWSVTVSGLSPTTKSSTTDAITFGGVAEGVTYSYTVESPISGYTASPSSGTKLVPVGTGAVIVDITYSAAKADPTVSVTWNGWTYDGTAHAASGFAYGVGGIGDVLSPAVTFSYAGTGATSYGPNAAAPADAGTYRVTASFAGNGNYNSASNTADVTVDKADANISVTGWSGTYDGNAHGVIASSATGVESPTPADLNSLLHVDATTYTDVPGGDVNWTFDGNTNYKSDSGSANVVITQADAIINVTGWSGIYDGNAHGASGTAVGVESPTPADLNSLLHVAATTYTDVPGGDVNWTFDGNTNYKSASGKATVTISQANSSLLYTGQQLVVTPSPLIVSARLTGPGPLGGLTIHFSLDYNPISGVAGTYDLGDATTNGNGDAVLTIGTTGWIDYITEVTATFAGSGNLKGSDDDAVITVAAPGSAATGGGWYTLSGSGRINFGFTVRQVPNSDPVEYKGQCLLLNKGKWRLKGELNNYGYDANTRMGSASGIGKLYWWDGTLNEGAGGWALAKADVPFSITFVDNNMGGGTGKNTKVVTPDKFGITIGYTPSDIQPPLPNSIPQPLKGGDISMKDLSAPTSGGITGGGKKK